MSGPDGTTEGAGDGATGGGRASRPSRRAVVVSGAAAVGVGAVALLAACSRTSSAGGSTAPAGSGPSSGSAPSGPSSSASSTATGPRTWAELAAATTGPLVRAGDTAWNTDRVLENPRYDDADPLAILRARSTADVVAGLAFARNTGTPVALRSGGHSYTGWSAGGATGTGVPRSLVISTADLDHVTLATGSSTASIGPGAPLIGVYDTLGRAGRAIGAGSCPTVGTGGLTLGGGVGVLVRSFGLTCDQLTDVTIVTSDGQVHHASASADAELDRDLFWACRGGGGGSVGVVTDMTFSTQAAPLVTLFALTFPWSAAASVVAAWQRWAPQADRRLWSTLKLLGGTRHASGPVVTVSGTWTGPKGGADAAVDAFIASTGATPTAHTAQDHPYRDAMMLLAGCGDLTTAECTTGPGGKLTRVPEAATSSMGTRALTAGEIAALVGQVEHAGSVPGLREGGVSLDALGGAVGDVGATDTAFPHRDALWTVQYTATFDDGAAPAPFDAYVRAFRQAMTPAWGTSAYANYVDAAITDPTAYFGDNTARLRRIAASVDPHGILAQPHWF